jgi:hypothetical protein
MNDYVLEKNGIIVIITACKNGQHYGYYSLTLIPNGDSFKVVQMQSPNFYSESKVEALMLNEVDRYSVQGYHNVRRFDYGGSVSVIFDIDGNLLSFSDGKNPHIAQCILGNQLKGFDKDVDYIIVSETENGKLVVENKYGESIICQKNEFRLSLPALGVKAA